LCGRILEQAAHAVCTPRAVNTEALAKLDATYTDAVQNLGDLEQMDAILAKAQFHCRIGNKEASLLALTEASTKAKVSTAQKIDAVLNMIRVGLWHLEGANADVDAIKAHIEQAKKSVAFSATVQSVLRSYFTVYSGPVRPPCPTVLLRLCSTKFTRLIDEGGDWDKRNRLKVYEGVFLIVQRDMKKASKLFLVGSPLVHV
jgi:26S proteasome regulatory subunit N7